MTPHLDLLPFAASPVPMRKDVEDRPVRPPGFRGGTQVLTDARETTGPAARILLRSDRARIVAGGEDVAMVAALVVDAQGRTVPTANDAITFDVSGNGRLLGVGNGDPSSHESDLGPSRRAFNGMCMAIAQAGDAAGPVRVRATANGLEAGAVEIMCNEQPGRPSP